MEDNIFAPEQEVLDLYKQKRYASYDRDQVIAMMMSELSQEDAIGLAEANSLQRLLNKTEIGLLQLSQPLLCCDFSVFHEALEFAIGRPVMIHELIHADCLMAELAGLKDTPTFQEILDLIPEEKRLKVYLPDQP